ncbi:MAG: hypothetical protein HKN03_13135 [Acidimicrobiales bacterium]|nr:hypothetical protein [Acidimicrobiales bacterium]
MIRRTAAITAASIAGVIIAGGAAVGANVGILNAANDPTFGTLSADATIFNSDDTSTSTSTSSTLLNRGDNQATQVFSVDTAGTVTVETDGTGLKVADVVANTGWTWEDAGHGSGRVIVRFISATDTLEFHANLNSDGSIEAQVNRPGINTTTGSVTTSPTGSYDDDHDDDHDEYEGRDNDHDDDHDEYEGRDDDD